MLGVAGALLGVLGSMHNSESAEEDRRRDYDEKERQARDWLKSYHDNTQREWCGDMRDNFEKGRDALRRADYLSARNFFNYALGNLQVCENEGARQVISRNLALVDEAEGAQQREKDEKARAEEQAHAIAERERLAQQAREVAERERLAKQARALQEQRVREEQERKRLAACQTAQGEHEAGSGALRALQPEAAISHYTLAMASFKACGQPSNVEVARRNLDLAQRMQAAMREEAGRFDEAQRRFASSSPYARDNPFAAGSDVGVPATERASVRIDAGNLYGEAAKMCRDAGAEGTENWTSCLRYAQAAVIRKFDPEVAGFCNAERESEARVDCTVNRYANTLAGRVRLVKAKQEDHVYEGYYDRKLPKAPVGKAGRSLTDALADDPGGGPSSIAPAPPPLKPVGVSGSAIAPGAPPRARTTQEEILEGLPQFTKEGRLPPRPDPGGSGISQ